MGPTRQLPHRKGAQRNDGSRRSIQGERPSTERRLCSICYSGHSVRLWSIEHSACVLFGPSKRAAVWGHFCHRYRNKLPGAYVGASCVFSRKQTSLLPPSRWFRQVPGTWCKFGTSPTMGTASSASVLLCISPPQLTNPGLAEVEVSSDGAAYSSDQIAFMYQGTCVPSGPRGRTIAQFQCCELANPNHLTRHSHCGLSECKCHFHSAIRRAKHRWHSSHDDWNGVFAGAELQPVTDCRVVSEIFLALRFSSLGA